MKVLKQLETPQALFKGMAAPLYSSIAVNALVFSTYAHATHTFESNENSAVLSKVRKLFSSGGIANPSKVQGNGGLNRGVIRVKDDVKHGGGEKGFTLFKHFLCGMWAGFVQVRRREAKANGEERSDEQ